MKSMLVLFSVLALSHHAFAQSCSAVTQYTTTLQPACSTGDIKVLWPNYKNFAQYYKCISVGNPVLENCAAGTYFSYDQQVCTTCSTFIPAPACEILRTQYKANCLPMNAPEIPIYTTTLQPDCIGNDSLVLWPNYENFQQYYRCLNGNPYLTNCAADTFFNYYLQMCTTPEKFLPAPTCEQLKTVNEPVCLPINGTPSTKPTETPTEKPTESPTEKPTEKPTEAPTEVPTEASTESPIVAPTIPPTPPTPQTPPAEDTTGGIPTPPTVPPPGDGVPTPPSPVTSAPDVPIPPSAAPTPPSIQPTPPNMSN